MLSVNRGYARMRLATARAPSREFAGNLFPVSDTPGGPCRLCSRQVQAEYSNRATSQPAPRCALRCAWVKRMRTKMPILCPGDPARMKVFQTEQTPASFRECYCVSISAEGVSRTSIGGGSIFLAASLQTEAAASACRQVTRRRPRSTRRALLSFARPHAPQCAARALA